MFDLSLRRLVLAVTEISLHIVCSESHIRTLQSAGKMLLEKCCRQGPKRGLCWLGSEETLDGAAFEISLEEKKLLQCNWILS